MNTRIQFQKSMAYPNGILIKGSQNMFILYVKGQKVEWTEDVRLRPSTMDIVDIIKTQGEKISNEFLPVKLNIHTDLK